MRTNMRRMFVLAVCAIVPLATANTAMAQRDAADRADRGQRLDSDAFRNDMLQDQLKKPAYPQTRQYLFQPGPGEKPKPDTRKPKPN